MLIAATPWFLEAHVRPCSDAWAALIRLDPTMALARAEQQGLANASLAAAAADDALRRMWAMYVIAVNQQLLPGRRIVSHTLVLEPLATTSAARRRRVNRPLVTW
jgi:hypothetical protein